MDFRDLVKNKNVLITTFNHFNHNTISDQTEFVYNGIKDITNVRIEKTLTPCNVLIIIEYFDDFLISKLKNFLVDKDIEIYVILTEHMDLVGKKFYFHGDDILNKSDYMDSRDKITRICGLLSISPYVSGFLRLFDLPELTNFNHIINNSNIYNLHSNSIINNYKNRKKGYDFLFYGKITVYRRKILNELNNNFKIKIVADFIKNDELQILSDNSLFVLSIPQNEDWKWSSPMRVIKSLKMGVPVLSISNKLKGKISDIILNLSINEADFVNLLRKSLLNSEKIFISQLIDFNKLCNEK